MRTECCQAECIMWTEAEKALLPKFDSVTDVTTSYIIRATYKDSY